MPFSLRKSAKLHLIAAGMIASLVILAIATGSPGWFRSGTAMEISNVIFLPTQQKVEAAADPTPEPITAETLTLTPAGFFPREFKHPKGRFILVVNNRTGESEINLTLSRDKGNKVLEKQKDAKVLRRQPDWNDIVDLAPGDYVLTEASHPKWECRMTITAR